MKKKNGLANSGFEQYFVCCGGKFARGLAEVVSDELRTEVIIDRLRVVRKIINNKKSNPCDSQRHPVQKGKP